MGKKKLRRTKYIKFSNDGRYPKEAYSPTTGKLYAMVRIALPDNNPRQPRYYRPDAPDGIPWVTVGYKTWNIKEWRATFGEEYLHDVRHWDFFGEEINIWESYSNE
jgi:hypothetical protein